MTNLNVILRAALALTAISVAFVFGLAACKGSSSTSDTSSTSAPQSGKKAYTTRGTVKSFGEGRKTVKIAHEEIPGYMKAMTMPFAVSAPLQSTLDGMNEGDAVDFSFTEESDGRMLIQSIKKK